MPKRPYFKVTYTHRKPLYWKITHKDGRWWSVAYVKQEHGLPRYVITNQRGQVLDEHGPTGRKLVDAVHDYERNT